MSGALGISITMSRHDICKTNSRFVKEPTLATQGDFTDHSFFYSE